MCLLLVVNTHKKRRLFIGIKLTFCVLFVVIIRAVNCNVYSLFYEHVVFISLKIIFIHFFILPLYVRVHCYLKKSRFR